jgi:cysteine-rich repeat protein
MKLLVLLALAGCGGAVCGNGKLEAGEQCDDGNLVDGDGCSSTCKYEPSVDTYIHWTFVATEFLPFDGESCDDVQAVKVGLTIAGPKPSTQVIDCGMYSIKLSRLPAGSYTVSAVATDASGAALTSGLATASFVVADQTQNVYVDFPFADFMRSYTGDYFFRVSWAGQNHCAAASPPVMKERLLMVRDGVPLMGETTDQTPIDGSKAGPCRDAGGGSQVVKGLDWGPAEITVTGEDAVGHALYSKTFATYVGAGPSNPAALLDVPSLAPDAGVPDAGVADAPLGDAGG